jgi:zinc transporter ZupT
MDDENDSTSWPAGMTGQGLRARRIARLMIVIAIVLPVMPGALVLSASRTMIGPMHSEDLNPLAAIVVGAGILAYVVGLAWMIRIHRTDPEAHRSFWRSRRF